MASYEGKVVRCLESHIDNKCYILLETELGITASHDVTSFRFRINSVKSARVFKMSLRRAARNKELALDSLSLDKVHQCLWSKPHAKCSLSIGDLIYL